MKFDPAAATTAYHADLENRDLVAVANWFAETATYQSPALGQISGRTAILAALQLYFSTNPNHTAQDQAIVAIADQVAEGQWYLTSNGQKRQGLERITYNEFGKITSIVVIDTQA